MKIKVPQQSLIVLIGASGSGKSTFAKKHFHPHEIISSDRCRGIVSNDENNLAATNDAFELLHYIIGKRLKNGLLTVIDATNVQASARRSLIQLAKKYHTLPVAIVLDIPASVSKERNKTRPDRNLSQHVIRSQKQQLRGSLRKLKKEGFRYLYTLQSVEEIDAITGILRQKLYNDKKDHHGPFDIIGDIHGCYQETIELLQKLDYQIQEVVDNGSNFGIEVSHPDNRQVIFLGDLVDRGPNSPAVLKLVMSMVHSGNALCVPGNHDFKLYKKLTGKNVTLKYGLDQTLIQLEKEPSTFIPQVKEFLYSLVSHYVLDDGKLVTAHAGLKEEMQGRGSGAVRSFCLLGETTGETDEFGLPVRHDWASEYRGKAKVIYGHTPVFEPEWLNKTLNIDTGCVFGGKLTALRYPEETWVTVDAKKVYYEPIRPLSQNNVQTLTQQQKDDGLLHIDDVLGKRIIQTRLRNNITIQEENARAALEVMSRFAINPKWLIYLPPTMSPCETSQQSHFLEYPTEAIDYYKKNGIQKLICEKKHMGSRVIVVINKDLEATLKNFGIQGEGIGVCYTRTGRNFFLDPIMEKAFIARVAQALEHSKFWERHHTDWVCLDAELMPWSAKAQSLLKEQYASVGSAAQHALLEVNHILQKSKERDLHDIAPLLDKFNYKKEATTKYIAAYRRYCWPVETVDDYQIAPFHILATEGAVHINKEHSWHMEQIKMLCQADKKILCPTPYKIVDTQDERSIKAAIDWWKTLTEKGEEGMVVKANSFIAYGKKGLLQPAIKCRGAEYLRIIYGLEYDREENLRRLRKRGLSKKRSLALREFALGIEGLERFVRKEPLRRIHESVFGVLALESEGVDPRL